MASAAPRDRSDFTIVLICALQVEAECLYEALDIVWDSKKYGKATNDSNTYVLGAIHEHNVVIAYLPGMITVRAASAVAHLRSSFVNIELALVVGVCSGLPHMTTNEQIVLGDVVISSALRLYDFGRQYPQGFVRKTDICDLIAPIGEHRALLQRLQTSQHKAVLQMNTAASLEAIQQNAPGMKYPGAETDILYPSSYSHRHHSFAQCAICLEGHETCIDAAETTCEALGCDTTTQVVRPRLVNPLTIQPRIHFGVMGSHGGIVTSGRYRDRFAQEDIIALEMEGAGIWQFTPSIVIKGVCDYADGHKTDNAWQRYAAATAMACAKAFLIEWLPRVQQSSSADESSEKQVTAPALLFGDLRYNQARHGWALEVGILLGNWTVGYSWHGTSITDLVNEKRRSDLSKRAIERRLRQYHIDYHLPEYGDEENHAYGGSKHRADTLQYGIIQRIKDTWSTQHAAFALIGLAGSMLEHEPTITSENAKHLQERARRAIGQLRVFCGDMFPDRIQMNEIYAQLERTNGLPDNIVQLLSDFQSSDSAGEAAKALERSSNELVPDARTQISSVDEGATSFQSNEFGKEESVSKISAFSESLPPLQSESPPTDSGYASLKHTASYKGHKQMEDDCLSITSDNEVIDIEEGLKSDLSSIFVDEIIRRIGDISTKSQNSIDSLLFYLPDLLKELSMDLKYLAQSRFEKNAATFIRHHRRDIMRRFKNYINSSRKQNPDIPLEHKPFLPDALSILEKVDRWSFSAPGHANETSDDDDNDDKFDSEVTQISDQYIESRKFIVDSSGFCKLIMKIDSLANLTARENTGIALLRRSIINTMIAQPTADVHPKGVLKHAVFVIDWNPAQFMQHSDLSEETLAFHEHLTLTGTPAEVQAATIGDYMEQVWPTTGVKTLDALQRALESLFLGKSEPQPSAVQYKFSDHTLVKIVHLVPQVRLEVLGLEHDLAEVGEQYSWLGAAYRPSPFEDQGCISAITLKSEKIFGIALFTVTFRTSRLRHLDTSIGSMGMPICWHKMFKQPVVVAGYPIKARINGEQGMETSIELMLNLAQTDQATDFDGGMVLKGFSTMLVPVRHTGNSVQWHFICDVTGNRLSYWEADKVNPERRALFNLDLGVLETARHFVGWSSAVVLKTGGADIDYETIGFTGSNFSRPGCALEKVQISTSHYFGGGMTFGKWNKNAPAYLKSSSFYNRKVDYARKICVILYDTHDRRGWLVDGASALLHLSRAKLSSRRFISSELLQLKNFDYPVLKCGPDIALLTLLKTTNRKLPIFEEWDEKSVTITVGDISTEEIRRKKTTWTFQNLVEETWGSLEQIHDHQVRQLQTPGVGLRGTTRDKLEGFGFKDIVEDYNPLRPRVAMLKSSGRGWVDLTRKLNAITLMATGFGELIQPAQGSSALCSDWKSVPKHRDYLATSTWLLQEICDNGGNQYSNPLELYDGIYWHKGTKLFEQCVDCRQCDRVQVLLPPSLGHGTHPKPFSNAGGGVVFGRSAKYRWKWPLLGNPFASSRGEEDLSTDDEADDSGLGTSI